MVRAGDRRVWPGRRRWPIAQLAAAAAAAQAAAISALFASHSAEEDSLLPPALESSGADLSAMIGREPRLAGSQYAA